MKLKIGTHPNRKSIELAYHMHGAKYPMSFYILPEELVPTRYPHVVSDCGRIAVFWGHCFTVQSSPFDHVSGMDDARAASELDCIACDTQKLLSVIQKLHARKVECTEIDTKRLHTVVELPLLTVAQLAQHPNCKGAGELGRTLKAFKAGLKEDISNRRSQFKDLIAELSRLVQVAKLYCNRDEFYFDGRYPGGCGYNGGVILHQDTFGIHT